MIALNALIKLLNKDYLIKYNTRLIGGFNEPFYLAFKEHKAAEIQFTHDYIRSALHELAHWCVAGSARRKLDDYGYWYAADGRNQQQQDDFFKVELLPQTIEWAFSLLCGVAFEASVDNLHGDVDGINVFKQNLHKNLEVRLSHGFSIRADGIFEVLSSYQGISGSYEFIANKYLLNQVK